MKGHRLPVPNGLVPLEHKIGELATSGLKRQTPTGSSRLVNEIQCGTDWQGNVCSPSLIHPRDELVGVFLLERALLTP